MGKYVTDQLEQRAVDIVLAHYRDPANFVLVKALGTHPEWQLVYSDDTHKLFVNATSAEGQRLINGIATGDTVYPDEYTRHTSLACFYQGKGPSSEADGVGLEHAIKAFQINPSVCAAQMIIKWKTESHELIERKKMICEGYVNQYEAHHAAFRHQVGFAQRRQAAQEMTAFVHRFKDPEIQP